MKAELLKIRLFLEMVEVPVVGAVVTSMENQPLQASIQIVAIDGALDLMERTVVHLFCYKPQRWDKRPGDEWKLVFCGEILGFNFNKTTVQRSIVLQCVDFSNYWEATKIMNVTGLGRRGEQLASFAGANTTVLTRNSIFENQSGAGFAQLVKLITSSPASFPKLEGVLGGVINLLEKIGGFYRGKTKFKGFNDFTSVAELRFKLLQQIHAAEDDDSSMKLLSSKILKKWVKQQIGGKGSLESFNAISTKLLQIVQHSRQSIPCPPYFPGKGREKLVDRWVPNDMGLSRVEMKLNNAVIMGMTTESVTDSVAASLLAKVRDAQASIRILQTANRLSAEAFKVDQDLSSIISLLESGTHNYNEAIQQLTKVVIRLDKKPKVNTESVLEEVDYERLGMHVFKPDIYFSPPPRCNVLFPEHYDSFTWARSYLEEPTRLMLHSGSGRSGDIFGGGHSKMGMYFAPDTVSVRKAIKLSSRKFATHIMEHEIVPGIVPTQVQIPWAKMFKIDHGKSKKYTYIQRLANFEYFKAHFSSRRGSVSGKLNIDFLAGFPTVIIDKCVVKDAEFTALAKAEGEKRAEILKTIVPAQYVGYCVGLTHTFSQGEGGKTSYDIAMLRSHREDGSRLGIDTIVRGSKTEGNWRSSYVGVKRGEDIKTYKVGPHGYKVSRAVKVGDPRPGRVYWRPRVGVKSSTGVWSETGGGSTVDCTHCGGDGVLTSVSGDNWVHEQVRKSAKCPVCGGKGQVESEEAPLKGMWVREKAQTVRGNYFFNIDPTGLHEVMRTAYLGYAPACDIYKITETIHSRTIATEKDIGLEGAITPPWLSKPWQIQNISDTYQKLFGVRAIMDELGVRIG